MFSFDHTTEGVVVSLGSFSKILAPALRLGWFQAKAPILKKIFDCGTLDSSGGINPVIQGIVHAAIDGGHQASHLDWTRATLWERCEALMGALREHLPEGVTFEEPQGGYFLIVRLPEHMDSAKLNAFCFAEGHKVQFLPGASFGTDYTNFLRLSFSYYGKEDMVTGAQRLGDAIRAFAKTDGEASGAGEVPVLKRQKTSSQD